MFHATSGRWVYYDHLGRTGESSRHLSLESLATRRDRPKACEIPWPVYSSQLFLGAMAQLVAHLHGMEGVGGSSPPSSTSGRRLENIEIPTFSGLFFSLRKRLETRKKHKKSTETAHTHPTERTNPSMPDATSSKSESNKSAYTSNVIAADA